MKYNGMRDCFAKTWRAEGARGFWKGIFPTLLRAMPVSAGTFAVVKMTMLELVPSTGLQFDIANGYFVMSLERYSVLLELDHGHKLKRDWSDK
ncbi:hypothetical protein ACHAP3_006823 [Botrytis cinerea]